MNNGQAQRIQEMPSPEAREPGWYPDPLGSTAERYWDGAWEELTRKPKVTHASGLPSQSAKKQKWGRQNLRRPLVGAGRKRLTVVEARKQAFFESPAGRADSFAKKHRLFQCELELSRPEPIVIPGIEGTAPKSTTDPVDILNSVIDEGWKLVAGSYFNGEMRVGAIGFYLFKRSKKRHRVMNDPWEGSDE